LQQQRTEFGWFPRSREFAAGTLQADTEPERKMNRENRYMIISNFAVFLALKYHNGYNKRNGIIIPTFDSEHA